MTKEKKTSQTSLGAGGNSPCQPPPPPHSQMIRDEQSAQWFEVWPDIWVGPDSIIVREVIHVKVKISRNFVAPQGTLHVWPFYSCRLTTLRSSQIAPWRNTTRLFTLRTRTRRICCHAVTGAENLDQPNGAMGKKQQRKTSKTQL